MTVAGITGGIGLLVATFIVLLVRQDHMQVGKASFWLITAVIFAFLGFAPALFDEAAKSIGVDYPPSLAFAIALVILALKALMDDVEISKVKLRQRRLIQSMAILKTELDERNGLSAAEREGDARDAE